MLRHHVLHALAGGVGAVVEKPVCDIDAVKLAVVHAGLCEGPQQDARAPTACDTDLDELGRPRCHYQTRKERGIHCRDARDRPRRLVGPKLTDDGRADGVEVAVRIVLERFHGEGKAAPVAGLYAISA